MWVEGTVPFGYSRATDGSRRLVIEPEEAPIVREMFEKAANGWSTVRLSKYLKAQYGGGGDRQFSQTWVGHALHNPIYTGKLSKTAVRPLHHNRAHPLPGEWIDAHEPIVPWDLFAVVQKAIESRNAGRKPDNDSGTAGFLMRGLARCALCKSTIASLPKRARHKSGYYVCNRRVSATKYGKDCPDAPYIRVDATDAQINREIGVALKAIKKGLARSPAQSKRPDFEKRRADVRKKRDNVVKLVAEGLVTFDAAANTLRDIESELAGVDAAEAEFNASLTQDTAENRKGALAFVERVSDEWDALTVDVRRSVLGALVREITVGRDQQPRIVWKDPGELAVDYAINALPELRVTAIKALPAPRVKVSDLLDAAQERAETTAK
jgi:hypothetical protein